MNKLELIRRWARSGGTALTILDSDLYKELVSSGMFKEEHPGRLILDVKGRVKIDADGTIIIDDERYGVLKPGDVFWLGYAGLDSESFTNMVNTLRSKYDIDIPPNSFVDLMETAVSIGNLLTKVVFRFDGRVFKEGKTRILGVEFHSITEYSRREEVHSAVSRFIEMLGVNLVGGGNSIKQSGDLLLIKFRASHKGLPISVFARVRGEYIDEVVASVNVSETPYKYNAIALILSKVYDEAKAPLGHENALLLHITKRVGPERASSIFRAMLNLLDKSVEVPAAGRKPVEIVDDVQRILSENGVPLLPSFLSIRENMAIYLEGKLRGGQTEAYITSLMRDSVYIMLPTLSERELMEAAALTSDPRRAYELGVSEWRRERRKLEELEAEKTEEAYMEY